MVYVSRHYATEFFVKRNRGLKPTAKVNMSLRDRSMPIDGGAPKQLTNFTTDQIAWFDLSRDGKPTLFSRGATTKDVVLISGFRK